MQENRRTVTALFACAALCTACGTPEPSLPEVVANDNRTSAGTMRGDTLELHLAAMMARWHPEAADGPSADVEALAIDGGAPRIPAPLIRVAAGTIVRVSVRNTLPDSTIWLHGLFTRPASTADSIGVAPGTTHTVTFAAGEPGTYWYGASPGSVHHEMVERETMYGGFIVDSAGATPDDRVYVMNIWGDAPDSLAYRNVLAINGKSFPHTESITPTIGDTLRWRWINATIRPHPMHLHGFYFTVLSRGGALRDTTYGVPDERLAVTERMLPGSTMALSWSPDRDGRWLFHCHIAFHAVSPGARLDADSSGMGAMGHDPGMHMAGLVLGIDVKAPPGWTPPPRESPRQLRLFVQEGPQRGRAPRSMRYAVEHGSGTPDSAFGRVTGPVLVLTRGQPTDVTVINTLREPTAVHWHGLELESYSDGVAGWSGDSARPAPMIAPADSFVARLTLARAGTFIYHTHLNDLDQLTSGLYGAIVVVEPGNSFEPARDHVFVVGWDGEGEPLHMIVNGDSLPPPMSWRLGRPHRMRFVNIGPAAYVTPTITMASDTVTWRAVAKDGADLPSHQRVSLPATTTLDVGETADFEFNPTARGEYRLTFHRPGRVPPVMQRIVVR